MTEIFDFLTGDATGILPFDNALIAAKIFFTVLALLIVYTIVRAVVYSRSLTLHKAPAAVVCAFIGASLANILICIFFNWTFALLLCIVITVIFMLTARSEINDANSEERMGIWGLNKDIRRIRSELFNDMTVEEQLEYRKKVKEYKFNMPLFFAAAIAVPILFVAACCVLDIGYNFTLPF